MKQLRVLSRVATICAAFVVSQQAHADYGSYGGYGSSGGFAGGASYGGSVGGSSGGFGSSGGYAAASAGYGSSGGMGSAGGASTGTGHVGPLRRLAARIHAHHASKVAARGSSGGGIGYGSSGGVASYGSSGAVASYGSSGGSSGGVSYGSSGGVSGFSGGSSGQAAPMMSYPAYESYSPMMQGSPMMDGGYDDGSMADPALPDAASEANIGKDAALLTIAVPESAKVIVNGLETTSRGEVRQFMSNGLKEGFVYTYVVDVTFADGRKAASKSVKLRAGAAERMVFNESSVPVTTVSASVTPETVVTLRVPADASVNLAGNDTAGSGGVRTFRTRQLSEGQKWGDYTIRVTAVVNGVSMTKEKTIDLVAGSEHDFTFAFDNAALASR
jgi:uncharacterized protein (TIGR03000 family)